MGISNLFPLLAEYVCGQITIVKRRKMKYGNVITKMKTMKMVTMRRRILGKENDKENCATEREEKDGLRQKNVKMMTKEMRRG